MARSIDWEKIWGRLNLMEISLGKEYCTDLYRRVENCRCTDLYKKIGGMADSKKLDQKLRN